MLQTFYSNNVMITWQMNYFCMGHQKAPYSETSFVILIVNSWEIHFVQQVQVKRSLQNPCLSFDITLAAMLAVRPLFGGEQHCQISTLCSIYLTGCWLIEVSVLRNASVAFSTLLCTLIFIISTDCCYEEQTLLVIRFYDRTALVISTNEMTLQYGLECHHICWNNFSATATHFSEVTLEFTLSLAGLWR